MDIDDINEILNEIKDYHFGLCSEYGDGRPQYHDGAIDAINEIKNKINAKNENT